MFFLKTNQYTPKVGADHLWLASWWLLHIITNTDLDVHIAHVLHLHLRMQTTEHARRPNYVVVG